MGVLDDAIREHLELKRKHGAPEQEVEHQAQEALGPVGRAPEPPAEDQAEPEVAAEQLPDDPATEISSEPAAAEPAAAESGPSEPADPIELEDETGEAAETEQEWEPAPEPPAGDTPPRGFAPVDDPQRASDADDEDVLEETPDFLQETPEHDRLWFEQKPPRDFDFDE
jgi:hypothetical protein